MPKSEDGRVVRIVAESRVVRSSNVRGGRRWGKKFWVVRMLVEE